MPDPGTSVEVYAEGTLSADREGGAKFGRGARCVRLDMPSTRLDAPMVSVPLQSDIRE
jgi:hypothetical protein